MRVRWAPAAASDFDQIKCYLTEHYPDLAQSTVLKIFAAVVSLKRMPYRGRRGRERDTRELILSPLPYIVVYRIKNDAIEVLHIYHGSRDR